MELGAIGLLTIEGDNLQHQPLGFNSRWKPVIYYTNNFALDVLN